MASQCEGCGATFEKKRAVVRRFCSMSCSNAATARMRVERGDVIGRGTKHGHATKGGFSPEYTSFAGVLERCRNKNADNYHRYGGAGVRVCDRWQGPNGFENFLSDMGPRPGRRFTLDRFPNREGDYEPRNVRWATDQQQANGRSSNRIIEFDGAKRTMAEWARHVGLSYCALQSRLDRGWPVGVALDPSARRSGA